MRTYQEYKERAIKLWEEGFSSKASKKNALGQINYSYESLEQIIRDGLLNSTPIKNRGTDEWNELYWGLPMYPHQWKEKHSNLYGDRFQDEVKEIEFLVELRISIKETEVIPPVKIDSPEDKKSREVQKTIEEIMKNSEEKFLNDYSLVEEFGGLSVTGRSHWGMNQHGTQFIRTFFYLHGKLTSLNSICAIYEIHKDAHPELYDEDGKLK